MVVTSRFSAHLRFSTRFLVATFFAFAPTAGAQSPTLVELTAQSPTQTPFVNGISADGSVAYGRAHLVDGDGNPLGVRPAYWNADGVLFPLEVPADDAIRPNGSVVAASADGSVLVGHGDADDTDPLSTAPLRWSGGGSPLRLAHFEIGNQNKRIAQALDVSADGSVACGFARRFDPDTGIAMGQDAIRWSADGTADPLESLGGSSTGVRYSSALVISADGSTIGGWSQRYLNGQFLGDRPALWTDGTNPTALQGIETSDDDNWSGSVTALSAEGTVAFGVVEKFVGGVSQGTVAVRWSNGGSPQEIGPRDALVAMPLFSDVVIGCSAAGDRAFGVVPVGAESRGFVWTAGSGTVDLTTLFEDDGEYVGSAVPNAMSADGKLIVGRSSLGGVGEAFVWYRGEMRSLRESLDDAGLDTQANGWESFDDALACSADGSVIVGTAVRDQRAVVFRAEVQRNAPPSITAPAPKTVECEGSDVFVTLRATAHDADLDDRLDVAWRVDGALVKTHRSLEPGEQSTLRFGYSHGEHVVTVSVDDGTTSVEVGTTVTVEDTTAPSVVVAPDVIVPTDPGKDFTTNVKLKRPTVVDLCDDDPVVKKIAPDTFPLGTTIVRWTARDDEGNVATAKQRVTVVDREKPRISGGDDVRASVDRGQTFATVDLPKATATDNVPEGLKVTTNAKRRYPVGQSTATWTATDAAGNKATWSLRVTVVNRPPVANAGKNVTVTTRSERGARVTLDGRKSSDPDGHNLTYRWSGRGVRFAKASSARTAATFPLGTTTAKLTVTDEAGAKRTDTVRVTVRLKNAQARPVGAAANDAFARSLVHSNEVAPKDLLDEDAGAAVASSFASYRLSVALGGHVVPHDGESPRDALLTYATLRNLQRAEGSAAARRWLAVYLRTGDDAAWTAFVESMRGVALASDDLSQP